MFFYWDSTHIKKHFFGKKNNFYWDSNLGPPFQSLPLFVIFEMVEVTSLYMLFSYKFFAQDRNCFFRHENVYFQILFCEVIYIGYIKNFVSTKLSIF